MSLSVYAAYLAACMPTVTLIVANSIRHGARAGLTNVAGGQTGIAIMIAIVGVGLTSAVEAMGHWFEWLRLLGAAYLIYMGIQMWRSKNALTAGGAARRPRGGFFMQGLLVALSNPKTLFFFGAFIPQFLDPEGDQTTQIAIMSATALVFGSVSDSAYAIAAGRAGQMLSASRIRLLSRVSGSFLIGGGVWLAFSRAK